MTAASQGLLVEGRNCWRISRADRAAFLIDGQDYFKAFVQAVSKAQKSIYICGWDIDSRVCLVRDDPAQLEAYRLGRFLDAVVSKTPGLQAYILVWDFAMIYAFEREPLPLFKLGWRTHRRVHFRMDDQHPIGASHHQKIVVIDDKIAFVGGLDLTKRRWDTREHRPDDPRRVDPGGQAYQPFHDIQMLVEGETARDLGHLFRLRWERATGRKLSAPRADDSNPWPPDFPPHLTDVKAAIARTEPLYKERPEVREVEAQYLEAIAWASKYIYLENQFLSSWAVTKALAGRLEEPEGPEIVIVLPKQSKGWIEESTVNSLQARNINHLKEADRYGRLGVYFPYLPGLDENFINVHAKAMVVDDCLLRIGSANLSNRSMGLDTECDLSIEASGQARVEAAIASFRYDLLGEHLGVLPEKVGETIKAGRSLLDAIEKLRGPGRTLKPLQVEKKQTHLPILPSPELADPEKPVNLDRLMEIILPKDIDSSGMFRAAALMAFVLVVGALAAAWRWGPLAEWLNPEAITRWTSMLRDNSIAPLYITAAFIAGGLVMFPVTILIGATALVFNPFLSMAYSLIGCLFSASISYSLGHNLGRETIRKIAGKRLNRLSKRMAKSGVVSIVIVRNLPLAPFPIVNMIAGASHIRFRDFVIGTLLGMAPGVAAITLLADRAHSFIKDPHGGNLALLGGIIAAAALGGLWVKRRFGAD